MTSARTELARQLVALPDHRWLPGMRWIAPIRPGGYGPDGNCGRIGDSLPWEPPDPDAWPDLDDDATGGALFVRLLSLCDERGLSFALEHGRELGVLASLISLGRRRSMRPALGTPLGEAVAIALIAIDARATGGW
jgi:hypothetical protein